MSSCSKKHNKKTYGGQGDGGELGDYISPIFIVFCIGWIIVPIVIKRYLS
jgi:hypothetical protein